MTVRILIIMLLFFSSVKASSLKTYHYLSNGPNHMIGFSAEKTIVKSVTFGDESTESFQCSNLLKCTDNYLVPLAIPPAHKKGRLRYGSEGFFVKRITSHETEKPNLYGIKGKFEWFSVTNGNDSYKFLYSEIRGIVIIIFRWGPDSELEVFKIDGECGLWSALKCHSMKNPNESDHPVRQAKLAKPYG